MMGRTRPEIRLLEEALNRFTFWVVVLAGLYVVFLPLCPGWESIREVGETHFLRVLVGFLLLYVAVIMRDRARVKSNFADLLEAFDNFNATLYGRSRKVTPEAITYLVTSLASKRPEVREKAHSLLVKITGQELGPEQEAWKRWWGPEPGYVSAPPPGRGGGLWSGPGPGSGRM